MKKTTTPTTTLTAPSGLDTTTCTIGLDLGDAQHACCILDAHAKILARGRVRNDRVSLGGFLSQWPGATIVMEAGTHSPWIARLIEAAGHRLILANPRKTRSIWKNKQKDDDRDAEQLAHLGRADPSLLHPLKHRSEQTQRDQSGEVDKQLRITKEGPSTLRRLLVSCAQYIMGPFGPPSALREAGERIAERGGKNARKRAVIAVARKLSVLLLTLWQKPDAPYEPFPQAAQAA